MAYAALVFCDRKAQALPVFFAWQRRADVNMVMELFDSTLCGLSFADDVIVDALIEGA